MDVPHAAGADRYDVVWDSPSQDHGGSMPLGNGDIGVNAWIEPGGDLVFYIAKSDSWDDNGRLLKVGRVRIAMNPSPFRFSSEFRQTLHLADGMMTVAYGPADVATHLQLWVDAHRPAIVVDIDSPRECEATASIELWRTGAYTLPSIECSDVWNQAPTPEPTVVEPDTVLTDQAGWIGWYHHNIKSVGPAMHARIQGVDGFQRPDPLLNRTFGAVVTAQDGWPVDPLRWNSPSSKRHRFTVHVVTRHPATPESWLEAVNETVIATETIAVDDRREAHQRWWREFWERSWIHVTAPGDRNDDAYVVSQAYALQRYMNACAGRGRYPIKFNGSLFTVPHPGKPGDADYRRWGPGYWWQNTRLPYVSMCASGDFDLMAPLFDLYGRDLMPLFKYRTRRHVGHDGVYIPECIYFWGDLFGETYGWTPFEERDDKLQASGWHKWEWVSGPELVFMMLDYYEHTLDETFLINRVLPTAHEILTFFDQHYSTDPAGRMVMHPAQALETWWDCTNPMPELAGLHAITDRLLELPAGITTDVQRRFWTAFKQKLPELPVCESNGRRMLAPADTFAVKKNIENPELYAVFPFRRVAMGKPDLDLGLQALDHRLDRGHSGWRQDDIFMAYLGRTDQAREFLVGRARQKHDGSRFPAFWGPNYDWVPDQDHGSILLKTLQAMIMQTDGTTVGLLPAWPKDWDVDFKLHAPYRTVVEGRLEKGQWVSLKVSPGHRRKDVQVFE